MLEKAKLKSKNFGNGPCGGSSAGGFGTERTGKCWTKSWHKDSIEVLQGKTPHCTAKVYILPVMHPTRHISAILFQIPKERSTCSLVVSL